MSDSPSDLMRAAAIAMRAEDVRAGPAPVLWDTVADLLDEIARQYDMPPCDSPAGVCNGCERREDFNDAVRVAETYLGQALAGRNVLIGREGETR
jgi:hypothetical protein